MTGQSSGKDGTPALPIIRERSEHNISRRNIDPDALRVLYRLHHGGYLAYLVGGGVRDLLLGRQPKDFDVGTNAHPHEIKRLFRNCFLIGRRFRLAHIRFGDKIIETSTFRRAPDPGSVSEAGGRHRDNTFGTPEEDAHRRDFTINALFYDIATFRVIDYVGGLRDLDGKVVRCIGDPDVRFVEDPVRMVRAARLAGRLGFEIDEATRQGMVRHAAEIAKASPPRLLEEIYRLFGYGTGAESVRILYQTGLLQHLFPELDALCSDSTGWSTLFWKCLEEHDRRSRAGGRVREALVMATLFFPLFMATWSHRDDVGGRRSLWEVAESVLRPTARRLTMPKRVYYRVVRMLTTQPRLERPWPDAAARRLARQDGFDESLELFAIQRVAHGMDMRPLEFWAAVRRQESGEKHGFRRRRGRPPFRRVGGGVEPPGEEIAHE